MKKLQIFLTIFILLAFFSNVSALDLKGKFALTPNAGLGIPLGDFADEKKGAAKTGFGLGGNVEYFVTDNVGIGGVFNYRSFGTETGAGGYGYPDIDITQKVTEFGAFVEYLFPAGEMLSPYLKLGAGFGKYKFDGTMKSGGVSIDFEGDFDSKLYISGGGGMIYMASQNIGLRGELLYTHLTTDGAKGEITILDVSAKGEWDYNTQFFSFFAGVTIFLGGPQ